VILIVIDTLRADHMSCYGYPRNTCPEIDALAKKGILFKNMLANTSWTRPGTASILTGLYPKNHRANTRDDNLAEEINLISEILSKNGYSSYAAVANGNCGAEVGFNQGYQTFTRCRKTKQIDKLNIHVRSDKVNTFVFDIIDNLSSKSNNFLYIHYVDPHAPYIPKEKVFSKSNQIVFAHSLFKSRKIYNMSSEKREPVIKEMINAYDDEVLFNDKMVGNLIQKLKEKKMYSNSIIVITSDHGEEFFEHGRLSHGLTLFEEQLRVPLIICLPNNMNREINHLANQIDIMPTILSLLNIPIPKNIDGIDLFNSRPRQDSHAELNLDGNLLNSIQTQKDKWIEGFHLQHRWFKESAVIQTDGNTLDLVIRSFYKKRTIIIQTDDRPIKELNIFPRKQTFQIHLPQSDPKTLITIKSLTPCDIPKELGVNDNTRCLSFYIFDSKNIKKKNILGEPYYGLFSISEDTLEAKNLFNKEKRTKINISLRNRMLKYKYDKRYFKLTKKKVKFTQDQIKILKALGYI
jgi:arylsulfatase A-like enzyme